MSRIAVAELNNDTFLEAIDIHERGLTKVAESFPVDIVENPAQIIIQKLYNLYACVVVIVSLLIIVLVYFYSR